MDRKEDIKLQVDKALESIKGINTVDTSPFFTDKTINRLRAKATEKAGFSYSAVLKIAAVFVLLVVNTYTIRFILNNNQQDTSVVSTATVKDLVNEYQPSDTNEITFEEKLQK